MTAASEEISKAVLAALPGLPSDTLASLMTGLESLGVQSREDLCYLKEDDLLTYLHPVQCRRLICAFTPKDPSSAPFLPGSPDPSSALFPPGSRETSSTLCCPDTPRTFNTRGQLLPSPHTPWPVNFKINWEKMPSEIQSAIANSTRPNPAARRAMIRSVVDQMREHNANPKRGICAQVANDIVRKYPQCFGDVDGDNNVAAASLLQQLKTRIEHLNRNNTMARLRQKRPSISGMRRQERGPMDQYGCVWWQPKELPAGETEESLQEMKRQMLQLYAQFGMAGAEKGEFQRWHENTYMLQRCDLNADPPLSISKIKDDWPFLFSLKGLFSHFSELTGISILEKLPAAIEQRSKTIIEYFEQHKTKAVSEVLDAFQEVNGSKAICIILCLLAHFNENGIFLKADPSAIAADIQEETLPSTPCLIVQELFAESTPRRAAKQRRDTSSMHLSAPS